MWKLFLGLRDWLHVHTELMKWVSLY